MNNRTFSLSAQVTLAPVVKALFLKSIFSTIHRLIVSTIMKHIVFNILKRTRNTWKFTQYVKIRNFIGNLYKKASLGFTNSHKQIIDPLFIFGFGKPLV